MINMEAKIKDPKRIAMGKKNRKKGGDFERDVRADLESQGYIVSKWSNNVQCEGMNDDGTWEKQDTKKKYKEYRGLSLCVAKHKFNPFNKVMTMGTGLPDFIAYKYLGVFKGVRASEVIGVESKSGKYLDSEERTKLLWLLSNNIFSKILIAYKNKETNELEYMEFK